MQTFNEIIKKIGEELDIKVTLLSDNWLTILEKDNEIHYITGYKFDLNNHGIGNVMDDKSLFYDVMMKFNLPMVEQMCFYKKYDEEKVLDYFHRNNNTLIVKGSLGTCGKNVFLVKKEKDLFERIDFLYQTQDVVIISPFYDIKNEYRVIVLNNEIKLIYGKERPVLKGNGISTIEELARNFNPYFSKHPEKIPDKDKVLKKDHEYILDYRFNLSNGAISFMDIPTDLKNKITDLALLVSTKLNITFASIDIINTNDNKLLVLEANSGVMMKSFINQDSNGLDIAYSIYRDAIKLMFNIQ